MVQVHRIIEMGGHQAVRESLSHQNIKLAITLKGHHLSEIVPPTTLSAEREVGGKWLDPA